jgi:hypothetical protein
VISGDGNWVVFSSEATNLSPQVKTPQADAYVWNRQTGALTLIPPAFTFPPGVNFPVNYYPSIDRTGHFIVVNAFGAVAELYDNVKHVASTSAIKNALLNIVLSGSGDFIAFTSLTALYPTDKNSTFDIYLEQRPDLISARPQITEPPLVQVTGTTALITLESFSTAFKTSKKPPPITDEFAQSDATEADLFPRRARPAPKPAAPAITATYVVTDVEPSGKILRRTSRRNQVALTNLQVGTHHVSYQITTFRGTKKVGKSNVSPVQTFTVGAPG